MHGALSKKETRCSDGIIYLIKYNTFLCIVILDTYMDINIRNSLINYFDGCTMKNLFRIHANVIISITQSITVHIKLELARKGKPR